jgi:RNA polymerase sigma-70 factor (ECF subfamily)
MEMSEDDSTLVRRVGRHEVGALADYLVEVRKPLLAYIERQLGTALRRKVEVEDIFQEVSVEAVRALAGADFAHRDPFSWLCQIAERRIIDAHRRFFGAEKRDAQREVALGTPGESSQHAALVDLLVASMTSPTQALSRKGREARLFAALASLAEEQREVLRLRYAEGLPTKEIAERLGKSDGAVRVMLTRSLDRLQRILGPDDAPR